MGRPSSYTPELAALVCARIAEAGSLTGAIAEDDKDELPGERTIYRWLAEREDFRQTYAHARAIGDEPMADEMLRVARDPDMPSDQKRILVDTMKWQLARRSAKKWGDKIQHADADGEKLAAPTFILQPVSSKPDGGE